MNPALWVPCGYLAVALVLLLCTATVPGGGPPGPVAVFLALTWTTPTGFLLLVLLSRGGGAADPTPRQSAVLRAAVGLGALVNAGLLGALVRTVLRQ